MRINFKKGFSLVEMLVYITILVMMLVIVLQVVVSLTKSDRVISALRNIENAAMLSIERIEREMRQAQDITVSQSTLDAHPGKLVLASTDTGGNPKTVEFYLSSGRLYLKENGADVGALTGNEAQITSLIFRRFTGDNSEGVRAEITLESGTSTAYRSKKFYATSVTR